MKRISLRASFLVSLLIAFAALAHAADGTATLTVDITGFEPSRGTALVQLSSTEEQFVGKSKPLQRKAVPVAGGKAKVTFEGLPFGEYAISVAHDEDDNGKLNTNMIGIPREAFGFSRNPVVRTGRPKFEAVKFPIDRSDTTIQVKVARLALW